MKPFDLFKYLNEKNNDEAFIYRCGYYIVNKNCNVYYGHKINDTFYTIFDNLLLKFDMIEKNDTQYFNIFKLRNLTALQIDTISCLTIDLEDINEDLLDIIMNIEQFKIDDLHK